MKKRFFSSLLMGALVTATLSTVTSCKDYDDDISNLQGQIDKLATVDQLEQKVTELKGLISTNSTSISSLQASIDKAQKAAEAAQSAADKKATLEEVKKLLADSDYATKKYVDDADAILDAAIKAVQTKDIADLTAAVKKAQEAADAAQTTADTAKQEAEAAGSKDSEAYKKAEAAATEAANAKAALEALQKSLGTGYSETQTVAEAISAINQMLKADKTGLSGLDSRLDVVEKALKGAEEGSTLNIANTLANIEASLKNIIGEYSTMVTAVELFGVNEGNAYYNFDSKLNFIQTEEQTNVFPKDGAADEKFTFEKGKYYVGEDSLLVRVSPVDAELTKENISLLNSQGQEISDDVIEVTSVSRNKELFTGYRETRAAGVNTGLWVVKFKAKDVTEKFEEAAIHKDEYGSKSSILYAVAVKNTYNTTGKAEDAKDRRVTSAYGVSLYTDVAQHGYDFTVNERPISLIKNRYTYDEDYKYSWNNSRYADIPELDWINNEPATEAITEGTDKNAANRTGIDERSGNPVRVIEKGKEITIDFSKYGDIKGFYVTLDTKFALQSAPSELNAWNSYTYEGVGYMKNGTTKVPATLFKGNKGSIVVKDLGNVAGDVIGFRVYAVNYDGTLTDPDGRAFYVAVGDVAVNATIPTADANCTIENGANLFATDYIAVNGAFDKDYDWADSWVNNDEDASGSKPVFDVKYYDKDKNEVSNQSGSDIAFVKFIMTSPTSFIDGATYTQSMKLWKRISNTATIVGTITVSAKKVMPTTAPSFAYRAGFEKLVAENHQYIIPANGYTCQGNNKGGRFDFKNMMIVNNNQYWNGGDAFYSNNGAFKFTVANGTFENGNKTEAIAENGTNFQLYVTNSNNENLVDNKTSHAITGEYEYYGISKKLDATTNTYVYKPYPVKSTSTANIVYCSWTDGFGVKTAAADNWVKNKKNEVKWTTAGTTTTTLDLAQLEVNIPAKAYISWATATAFSGNLKALLDANYLTIVADDNYGDVYTTGTGNASSQINPYFTAAFDGHNIKLTQANQNALPSSVNAGTIHFTVKDCFGNKIALALPFVIKK